MSLRDAQGRSIQLGQEIGRGGEAVVYTVANQSDLLAKIYEPEPRPNYPKKLAWMVGHPPHNPTSGLSHASLAWPDGLIFDSKGNLKGYTMPFIRRAVPVLDVFNPRRRAEVLPQFDRRYLHRTARNLAAALSALHTSGYVAGDLNESNVLVTPTALVTLIDTDSFQVTEDYGSRTVIHPCPVGKPEYTPPELQGKNLSNVAREVDHDAFGLAVLIFQLLMEGSHPFRAQWLGQDDPPPLEARIAQGAFPYAKRPPANVAPPKRALPFDTLHPWLVELFRRCFVDGHRDPRYRPGPDLWVKALTKAEESLIYCAQGHYYSGHLGSCPYCPRQQPQASYRPSPQKEAVPNRQAAHETARSARSTHRSWGRRSWRTNQTYGQAASSRTAAASSAAAGGSARSAGGQPGGASFGGWAAPPRASTGSSAAASAGTAQSSPFGFGNFPGGRFTFSGFPGSASGGLNIPRYPNLRSFTLNNWVRPRAYKSFTIGGAQGAAAGALLGMLVSLINWFSGDVMAWSLLFPLGGTAGGLLRGWKPGHRLGSIISRYIGWKRFWEGFGLVTGAVIGLMMGMVFIWAVIPVILGLILGAQTGKYVGGKIYQFGSVLGWERIWAGLSALSAAGIGFGVAKLAGTLGMNAFGAQLANALLPFAVDGSALSAVGWALAGGAGGAIAGGLAGIAADLFGRLSGLVD